MLLPGALLVYPARIGGYTDCATKYWGETRLRPGVRPTTVDGAHAHVISIIHRTKRVLVQAPVRLCRTLLPTQQHDGSKQYCLLTSTGGYRRIEQSSCCLSLLLLPLYTAVAAVESALSRECHLDHFLLERQRVTDRTVTTSPPWAGYLVLAA